jgi:hypothetical protein
MAVSGELWDCLVSAGICEGFARLWHVRVLTLIGERIGKNRKDVQ